MILNLGMQSWFTSTNAERILAPNPVEIIVSELSAVKKQRKC